MRSENLYNYYCSKARACEIRGMRYAGKNMEMVAYYARKAEEYYEKAYALVMEV